MFELNEPNPCSCSLLEIIFRFSSIIHEKFQDNMEKTFYKLFPNFEFKNYLVATFSKMFNFIMVTKRYKYFKPREKLGLERVIKPSIILSNIRPLYTQFFTEELRRI